MDKQLSSLWSFESIDFDNRDHIVPNLSLSLRMSVNETHRVQ